MVFHSTRVVCVCVFETCTTWKDVWLRNSCREQFPSGKFITIPEILIDKLFCKDFEALKRAVYILVKFRRVEAAHAHLKRDEPA